MESILEQLVADFRERPLPKVTRRDIRLPSLPRKADVVVGMRRTGKTWFLFQVVSELLEDGNPLESIVYLNFEDERLAQMDLAALGRIPEVHYRRFPHLRDRTCHFFFDEVQQVPGWERFVRRLLDTEDVRVYASGSSARLLSTEIATQMRGRSLTTEMFPFSFREALRHARIDAPKDRPGSKRRSLLENRFEAYLLVGGFPEVQDISLPTRTRVLQEYLDVVILRDLVERHGIPGTTPIRYMIRHFLNAPGGLFSVNKFHNDLKSQGIPCGKNTLHDYLRYLSDAYLFFPVSLHASSERARMVNPRKVYSIDCGLVRACSRRVRPDTGHLLENFVFLDLRRRGGTIEYYRTRRGGEVDFLWQDVSGELALVQVCANLTEPETRRREVTALEDAMEECGLDRGTILTMNQEERIEGRAGEIRARPAWSWALAGR